MNAGSWHWLAMRGLIDSGHPPPGGELAKPALLTPTSPVEAARAAAAAPNDPQDC
jgi:hypothetical protein